MDIWICKMCTINQQPLKCLMDQNVGKSDIQLKINLKCLNRESRDQKTVFQTLLSSSALTAGGLSILVIRENDLFQLRFNHLTSTERDHQRSGTYHFRVRATGLLTKDETSWTILRNLSSPFTMFFNCRLVSLSAKLLNQPLEYHI